MNDRRHGPIRGVIFDLDDTLFDCTGLLTVPARDRAARALAPHTGLEIAQLVDLQTDLAAEVGSSEAIRSIGRTHNLPDDLITTVLETYNRDDVPAIDPFPDGIETVETLRGWELFVAVVTTGRRTRQLAKLERLGLAHYFTEDRNLFIHDDPTQPDKGPQLLRAISTGDLAPSETLSVGDKLDADVAVGNRLGLITVHYRHGRQADRAPADASEQPAYQIERLKALLTIVRPRD